jgi:hypothetical protein
MTGDQSQPKFKPEYTPQEFKRIWKMFDDCEKKIGREGSV